MSVAIYTAELAISLYDEVNQRFGPYTDPKNMLSIQITKPEPTNIKDVSSRPDSTFAQTNESFLIGTGSPELTISTRDMVNRETTPVEMSMLAAALSATASSLAEGASTGHYFSAAVDQMEMNYDTGKRNLAPASSEVYLQESPTTGTATGTATGGSGTTLTDSGQSWTSSDLIGSAVAIVGGTGAGQVEAITANTATEITVSSFSPTPDATSQYAIVASATPLVEDTDYTVDAVYGTIKPLSTGTVSADNVLHGFVDSYAISGTRFKGATKDAVTFRARGKAKDIKNGNVGFLTIHKVVSYSSASQEFVANAESPEFKTLELSGEMETPAGQDAPYTFDDNVVYASS
jgi:F0F1-type ATP synthase membrane subunit c/vacuolar-type H+-ATPase subunit K